MTTIGVISDTHGLLRPEALDALQGSDMILHAGDVGDPSILDRLREIAPVHAVRGNVDVGPDWSHLPVTEAVEVGEVVLYMLHIIEDLGLSPVAAGMHAVIYGHTHTPLIRWKDGVLYMNPGSAGPRRFSLPVTVGRIRVAESGLEPELIELRV